MVSYCDVRQRLNVRRFIRTRVPDCSRNPHGVFNKKLVFICLPELKQLLSQFTKIPFFNEKKLNFVDTTLTLTITLIKKNTIRTHWFGTRLSLPMTVRVISAISRNFPAQNLNEILSLLKLFLSQPTQSNRITSLVFKVRCKLQQLINMFMAYGLTALNPNVNNGFQTFLQKEQSFCKLQSKELKSNTKVWNIRFSKMQLRFDYKHRDLVQKGRGSVQPFSSENVYCEATSSFSASIISFQNEHCFVFFLSSICSQKHNV